ncbi:MAG: PQQ-dependent sugar dehydrogenase [Acidobacteria bacterium]|nr:PQQ-dependent sugar dehydrogenase [Acidobacteriota bacterium]
MPATIARMGAPTRPAACFALILAMQVHGACPSPSPSTDPTPTNPQPPAPIPTEVFTAEDGTRFGLQTYLSGLVVPWSLAFAPDGRLFITERPGRVRIAQNGTLITAPALTLTDVAADGEAGLLGIALHPSFDANHLVYLVYTAQTSGGRVNRLVRYREVNQTLGERAVLLDNIPAASTHDGSRSASGLTASCT